MAWGGYTCLLHVVGMLQQHTHRLGVSHWAPTLGVVTEAPASCFHTAHGGETVRNNRGRGWSSDMRPGQGRSHPRRLGWGWRRDCSLGCLYFWWGSEACMEWKLKIRFCSFQHSGLKQMNFVDKSEAIAALSSLLAPGADSGTCMHRWLSVEDAAANLELPAPTQSILGAEPRHLLLLSTSDVISVNTGIWE